MQRNKDSIKFWYIIFYIIQKRHEYCISFLYHLTLTTYYKLMSNSINSPPQRSMEKPLSSCITFQHVPMSYILRTGSFWYMYVFCLCVFALVLDWINILTFQGPTPVLHFLHSFLKNIWIGSFLFFCLTDKHITYKLFVRQKILLNIKDKTYFWSIYYTIGGTVSIIVPPNSVNLVLIL